MPKLILFLLLIVIGAPSVQAGDTNNSMRHFMEFCSQFVITDPGPGIRLDYRPDCYPNGWDARWCWNADDRPCFGRVREQ